MATSTSRVMPASSQTNTAEFKPLDPDSYTANRLKHASPEHLHVTSHRFFIGPIPEGWLNSNRKSWYKRRLELSTYSSKKATFDAATSSGPHHRTLTGLGGPSTAARMSFSFPQPEDVHDRNSIGGPMPDRGTEDNETEEVEEEYEEEEDDDDDEEEIETVDLAPVATTDLANFGEGSGEEDQASTTRSITPKAIPTLDRTKDKKTRAKRRSTSPEPESFTTAQEDVAGPHEAESSPFALRDPTDSPQRDDGGDQGPSNRASLQPSALTQEDTDANSRTSLLTSKRGNQHAERSLRAHDPAPMSDDRPYQLGRANTGVRFKVSEGVHHGKHRITNKAGRARDRVANKRLRRDTLREGTIVKMERMLTKIDITMQQVPEEFDENESIKLETRVLEKWREFMVVARKSKKQDTHDFRLQIYKTRVIPEIDDESTKKKPFHEIRLDPNTTRVNLYSSLDKTVVIWHPYKKGTRIFVMRATSTAHSVEWYTFLRDALGWQRPATLQVNVPDLDVVLKLENPFEGIERAGQGAETEETAIARTVAAEQAVAGKIISQCIEMLERDSEWSSVLKTWTETAKMGLAWKRYDRLEWVYGANEDKMYGTMAMQQSHDLELRPKQHYPTVAHGKKGKQHDEPPPIEGFLIRLTSQKGIQQRFGKAFFKRLYFTTHNQFLIFNRPAKATPPHPPRLITIGGSNVPSAHEIAEKTPLMYDVEPFKLHGGGISWMASGNPQSLQCHDREAIEEARRNVANITDSDGFIDLCHVQKVRVMNWGASPADETLDVGSDSDVDFHEDVHDTRAEDGTTKGIDDERVFEMVLDNGLVVRLQAYSKQTRDEWIHRLRKLVKYWKLRIKAEMDTFKAVRHTNLTQLNIDEEMEAFIGQFAKKWEVSRSEASPELYNMCGISSCRSITMSGSLYLKTRRRSTFHRSQVILSGGQLLIYQATARKRTGQQIHHIHQEKQQVVDLRDCYVYSGLIVEDDLLYQNKTFDANHPGMASLPRVYLEDGWTSADVDVMTCFVVWMNKRKGWFKTAVKAESSIDDANSKGGKRARLKRVRQLGVPGRGMVFKCRSRAERDHWVLSVASEIERVVQREEEELGEEGEVRFDS